MDRKEFNCTTWLHKAASLPKEDFKGEVKKYLTGRKTESCPVRNFFTSPLKSSFGSDAATPKRRLQRGSEKIPDRPKDRILPGEQQNRFLHEITSTPCRD